jgi:hypothetical protein
MQWRIVGAGGISSRRMLSLTALAAALGLASIAPQAAMAGSAYHGELVPPQVGHGTPSEIEFNVDADKNKKGKLVPDQVKRFRSRAVTMYCANGNTWWHGLGNASVGGTLGWEDHPNGGIAVKKRKFHDATDGEYGPSSGFYEISGQIPKKGPATGTIRLTYPNEAQGGYCDSGVVNWIAYPAG